MKKFFAILLFVVLLATTTFGYAVAQNKVDPRMIDMEKRRLEETLNRYNNNPNLQGKTKENAINRVKASMDELDRDPEYYFYKKQEQGPKSSPKTVIGIDPSTGKSVTVIVK